MNKSTHTTTPKSLLFFTEIDDRIVAINLKESPLRWLATRKDTNGQPYLELHEIEAGERYRADFTKAGLSPRMGVNFDNISSGGRSPESFSDMRLAAIERMALARKVIGPELSSLMTDFLGFLIGLEECETQRNWPARSAKVVVKLALSHLARHYGYASVARGVTPQRAPSHKPTPSRRATKPVQVLQKSPTATREGLGNLRQKQSLPNPR
jgi:hypothetical protein